MGAAAVISLAEAREQRQRAELRRQLHERFEQWLDTLEEHVKEPKPALEQITRAVWEVRQELTGSLTEALLEQCYRPEQEQRSAPCPQCGRLVAARAVVSRTLETLVGRVEVDRPYFYCVPCGQGFFPLDATLGLAGGHKQFDVQQAAAKVAAEVFRGLVGLPLFLRADRLTQQAVRVAPHLMPVEEMDTDAAQGREPCHAAQELDVEVILHGW